MCNKPINDMNKPRIIIAIDGFSSCGKSTMAKDLARNIGYTYIDSGAMYRAVTLYALEHRLIHNDGIDVDALREQMPHIDITFATDPATGKQVTCLNGKCVEQQIRSMEVSRFVSLVSKIDFVRSSLVALQRKMGEQKGIVMDGRDIGTAVFPHAELKIFVTASVHTRAQRRADEMKAAGEKADIAEIEQNIAMRDHNDMTRDISPLKKADDAILLDNSHMSIDEQNHWLYDRYNETIDRIAQSHS